MFGKQDISFPAVFLCPVPGSLRSMSPWLSPWRINSGNFFCVLVNFTCQLPGLRNMKQSIKHFVGMFVMMFPGEINIWASGLGKVDILPNVSGFTQSVESPQRTRRWREGKFTLYFSWDICLLLLRLQCSWFSGLGLGLNYSLQMVSSYTFQPL